MAARQIFSLPTETSYVKFARQSETWRKTTFSAASKRLVKKSIKSYVELNLQTIGMDAITSVCLGPKCALTKNDVMLFLFSEQISVPAENITSSLATYR